MRNIIPGKQVNCYCDTTIMIIDATYLQSGSSNLDFPTINIRMSKGERYGLSTGVREVDSPMNSNMQLTEFELADFATFLLGNKPSFTAKRDWGMFNVVRQIAPDGKTLKIYAKSHKINENRYLAIPVPAGQIYFIVALVLSQLQKLSGGLPMDIVRESLSAMCNLHQVTQSHL